MTKTEFIYKIPDIINHKTWGYGEFEIIVDSKDKKGVCYRHPDKIASFGTYGSTWLEIYEKLSKSLISEGYIK